MPYWFVYLFPIVDTCNVWCEHVRLEMSIVYEAINQSGLCVTVVAPVTPHYLDVWSKGEGPSLSFNSRIENASCY